MTEEALAMQQVWAAWVSAVAACIQAFGAITAIAISIKLARDAASREIEAAQRSEAREIAAEAASVARSEAAEAAALKRTEDALAAERETLLIPIIASAEKAKSSLRDEALSIRQAQSGIRYIGPFTSSETNSLFSLIEEIKPRIKETRLLYAVMKLEKLINPALAPNGTHEASALVAEKENLASQIETCILEIEGCRMPVIYRM
ncbi:MAG: hypothetical protein ACRYG8_26340 [Janthinobacterium lividum]